MVRLLQMLVCCAFAAVYCTEWTDPDEYVDNLTEELALWAIRRNDTVVPVANVTQIFRLTHRGYILGERIKLTSGSATKLGVNTGRLIDRYMGTDEAYVRAVISVHMKLTYSLLVTVDGLRHSVPGKAEMNMPSCEILLKVSHRPASNRTYLHYSTYRLADARARYSPNNEVVRVAESYAETWFALQDFWDQFEDLTEQLFGPQLKDAAENRVPFPIRE